MGIIDNKVIFGKGKHTWMRVFWILVGEAAISQIHEKGDEKGVVHFKVIG